MKRINDKRRLHLSAESIRILAGDELDLVIAGRRGTTSEAEGNGPCPTDYTYVCQTGARVNLTK